MKKLMILLAILIAGNVMLAQERDYQNAFQYNRNGYYARAMQAIEKSVNHEGFLGQKPGKQAKAWLLRATIYQSVLESGDAELIAQAPNALEIIQESLMKCMENKEFLEENKAEIYQRVAVVMDNYSAQGNEMIDAKDYSGASVMFKKAYDIAKSLGTDDANDRLTNAALSSLLAQDYDAALAYYTELKDNGVKTGNVYRHLAVCYNAKGDAEKALEMINAGLEVEPGNADLVIEKVNAYLKDGRASEVIEELNKLREMEPDNVHVLFALGTVYGDEKNEGVYDFDKAVNCYEEAVRINPDFNDAVNNLGFLYFTTGYKLKTQANELPLGDPGYDPLMQRSNELVRLGLPYVKKTYELQPTPEIKNVLKVIYSQLEMYEEAKALN